MLARRDSPATLGLEMSEKPTNGLASQFWYSDTDSHDLSTPRMRGVATAHHERFSYSTTRKWVRILAISAMFSIRWASFRNFPFLSAFISVHPRPNDFSQDSPEWLRHAKCRTAANPATSQNSGKLNKESE
jgi:hypothetical protein